METICETDLHQCTKEIVTNEQGDQIKVLVGTDENEQKVGLISYGNIDNKVIDTLEKKGVGLVKIKSENVCFDKYIPKIKIHCDGIVRCSNIEDADFANINTRYFVFYKCNKITNITAKEIEFNQCNNISNVKSITVLCLSNHHDDNYIINITNIKANYLIAKKCEFNLSGCVNVKEIHNDYESNLNLNGLPKDSNIGFIQNKNNTKTGVRKNEKINCNIIE